MPARRRPLYAAHAGPAWPDEPHLQLWWAATLLREHRGDGHIAGLVTRGIDAVESLVFHAATGEVAAEHVLPMRGWTQDDWDAATARLRARGWVDQAGRLTTAGAEVRADLEAETDELALPPGTADDVAALCERLESLGLGPG